MKFTSWSHEAYFVQDQGRNPEGTALADIHKKFGERVVSLRKERNWTQEDLADASGISTRSISSIENGHFSITLENIEKLAKAFRMKLKDLFDF